MSPIRTSLLALAVFASGCGYTEDALEHFDLFGTVRIPKEAAAITVTQTTEDDEGNSTSQDVDLEADVRNLGPVYLGVFPGIDNNLFEFPHPEIGPVLSEDTLDSYPYGGVTVGRPDFACYEMLVCKVTTGRFTSYDDVMEYFRDELKEPIVNQYGDEVTSAIEFREWCYETMFLTSDNEIPFLSLDGPDFVDKGDYWEADATIYHSYFRENSVVWGWMDAPTRSYNFASCTDVGQQAGWFQFYYTENFATGATYPQILNTPATFIDRGDWISESGYTMKSPEDNFVVELGYKYE